jgi:hypothetical protein
MLDGFTRKVAAEVRPPRPARARCAEARMLASELDLHLAERDPDFAPERLAAIQQGFASTSGFEQVAAAIELRRTLLARLDEARLEPLVASLRERWSLARGRRHEDRHRGQSNASADELRGEAESLLEQLKLIYTFGIAREARLSRMRFACLALLVVSAIGVVGTTGIEAYRALPMGGAGEVQLTSVATSTAAQVNEFKLNSFINYLALAFTAATGAAVSMVQRIHQFGQTPLLSSDPVAQISGLRSAQSSLVMAALTGPTFALVLLAAFASNAFSLGDITPKFAPCGPDSLPGFILLNRCSAVASHADAAKLLVWAFLAGFAERLVPDVLDRFIGAAEKQAAEAKGP